MSSKERERERCTLAFSQRLHAQVHLGRGRGQSEKCPTDKHDDDDGRVLVEVEKQNAKKRHVLLVEIVDGDADERTVIHG